MLIDLSADPGTTFVAVYRGFRLGGVRDAAACLSGLEQANETRPVRHLLNRGSGAIQIHSISRRLLRTATALIQALHPEAEHESSFVAGAKQSLFANACRHLRGNALTCPGRDTRGV